jgi:hypothetical protein
VHDHTYGNIFGNPATVYEVTILPLHARSCHTGVSWTPAPQTPPHTAASAHLATEHAHANPSVRLNVQARDALGVLVGQIGPLDPSHDEPAPALGDAQPLSRVGTTDLTACAREAKDIFAAKRVPPSAIEDRAIFFRKHFHIRTTATLYQELVEEFF